MGSPKGGKKLVGEMVEHCEVLVDGKSIGEFKSHRTALKKKRQLEKRIESTYAVERLIFPAIVHWMLKLNNEQRGKEECPKTRSKLLEYFNSIADKDGAMQSQFYRRKVDKIIGVVLKYGELKGFNTRRIILMAIMLYFWLKDEAQYPFDDECTDIFSAMRDEVIEVSDDLPNFEEIERGAKKKAFDFLAVIQELGYFPLGVGHV